MIYKRTNALRKAKINVRTVRGSRHEVHARYTHVRVRLFRDATTTAVENFGANSRALIARLI